MQDDNQRKCHYSTIGIQANGSCICCLLPGALPLAMFYDLFGEFS